MVSAGNIAQVGAHTRDSTNDGSVKVEIVESLVHRDYNDSTKEYDFQIVKLSGWVSPICNNTSEFTFS